jgi:NAD(P)-dependent dehydrogenase (short-subunit alcohol dehydrogenase family)
MSLLARDLFDVSGKTALITGGSSGIGKMIATTLAANGVRVTIVGRKEKELAAAAAEIGHGCRTIQADISKMPDIDRVAAEFAAHEPKLNILVNNAGATWAAPVASFPESGWDRVMGLNVKSVFFLIQKLLPSLSAAGSLEDFARVINLSSVATTMTYKESSPVYGPSKAAVEQMTRALVRILEDHHVTVNAISPGWFPSRMNAPITEAGGEAWKAATPHRRFGTIEEMGGLALFLCSRAGGYINGQTIVIDGGRSI